MSKFLFNKVIRDKLINKILNQGVTIEKITLNEQEYLNQLKAKLLEEATEVIQAQTHNKIADELADLLEVIYAIAKITDIPLAEIEKLRMQKLEEKGGFTKQVMVKSVKFPEKIDDELDYWLNKFRKYPEKYPEIT